MDFAVCPACKQSVLDDDAVNCPFCGSSMKAKPGSAKPASAAAVPAKAIAAKSPAAKPAAKAAPAEDAPFDIAEDHSSHAIPASTNRTKSRPLRVQCPMCETVGYVPADAAGQAVKCANPKCLMPVFTAPAPEPEQPPPPPPPKPKRSLLLVGGATVAIMAVGGGLAWWIAGQPQTTTLKGPSLEDLELIKEIANPNTPVPKTAETTKPTPKPEDSAPVETDHPPVVSDSAWQTAMLKMMNDASLQPRQNRSKPFCRRMTAETFALVGNLDGAAGQLSALDKVGKDVPFYRVSPLVEIGWQQLAKGDRKAAAKSVEQAWVSAAKLPKTGRDRLETTISLSALLIATKRDADAATLLETHQTSDPLAQLAAMHQAVLAFGTFDLAEADARRPALPWQFPLQVGVVLELVAHQQADLAQQWTAKLPVGRERAEALGAWAEGVVWLAGLNGLNGANVSVEELSDVLEALPAPGNSLALSRLGLSLSLAGKTEPAEQCLTKAADHLAKAAAFAEESLPDGLVELSKFHPHDPVPRESLASAAAETAHLAAQLGQTEQAESLLQTALLQIRTIAPNPASIQRRLKQSESAGINTLREELKRQLKLKTREDAIVAANAYKKNLDDWADAAQRRVKLQTELLTEAVGWGLLDAVWNTIRRGTTAEDAAEADNLIFTHLPSLLAEKYQATGRTDRYELVTAAWNQLVPDRRLESPPATVLREALKSGKSKQYQQAAQLIKDWKGPPAEQDWLAMRAVCEAAASGRLEPALVLTSRLADPVLKEECYLLIAGIAGRTGKIQPVETHLAEVGQASEKVALGCGLLSGQAVRNSRSAKE